MEIRKATKVAEGGMATEVQMEAINAQAKAKLTAEQVYVFSLRLCDDQVDRDFERFDRDALPALAKMFIGKTGIADHKWSSENQVARIFSTEVAEEEGVTFIRAWAYIRRGGSTDEVIADIEAGIKREVSVACSMGRSVCSICGSDYGSCGHGKGEYYDGQLCCAILREPMDAYEFSFVAVPAQPNAGVLKGLDGGKRSLKELADAYGAQGEYRALFKEAELGRQYKCRIQDDVVRLCLSLDLGADEPTLRAVAKTAGAEELLKLKEALEKKLAACMPMMSQLGGSFRKEEALESGYLI